MTNYDDPDMENCESELFQNEMENEIPGYDEDDFEDPPISIPKQKYRKTKGDSIP